MVKLDEATLTSQGQVSIPKKVRERLHLEKGDRVVFWEDERGCVVLREVEKPLDFTHAEWQTFLSKTKKEPVTRVRGVRAALSHLDRLSRK